MGLIRLFRGIKEIREKRKAREAEIADLPNRSLDGTYKLVMVYINFGRKPVDLQSMG